MGAERGDPPGVQPLLFFSKEKRDPDHEKKNNSGLTCYSRHHSVIKKEKVLKSPTHGREKRRGKHNTRLIDLYRF